MIVLRELYSKFTGALIYSERFVCRTYDDVMACLRQYTYEEEKVVSRATLEGANE